jgi:hypothetical protein
MGNSEVPSKGEGTNSGYQGLTPNPAVCSPDVVGEARGLGRGKTFAGEFRDRREGCRRSGL